MTTATRSTRPFGSWRYSIVGAIALALLAFAASFCMRHGIGWSCPMRLLFHIPCPSCGSTRALAALSRFEFVEAFRFNPLLTLTPALCLVIPFSRKAPLALRGVGWPLLCAALFLNWLYLLFYLPP
jgi:hypothetical protein